MQVAIDKLSDVLLGCPHFKCLQSLCNDKPAYLVGGAVRDALIGRPVTDFDLVFAEDPTAIAKDFAKQIGGHWFWLDKSRRQSRVVLNQNVAGPDFDFAPFRAETLAGDLFDRDFTINALAIPLINLSTPTLIDPCNGLADLQQKSLRMVSDQAFANDPLRIVKGVRHATVLGLEIDEATLQAMREEAVELCRSAPERVRQEIWKVIADEHVARGLQLLGESGAGAQLFGAVFATLLPQLARPFEESRAKWRQLAKARPQVKVWLAAEIEQGLSAETLLLWTAFLSFIDRGLPTLLAAKWRLSRRASRYVSAQVALPSDLLQKFSTIACNERAFSWWAVRRHMEPKLLLLTLAAIVSPQDESAFALISRWVPLVAALDDQRPTELIDGHWLRNELHLKDGPDMSIALELLRNAEIFGQVSNAEEACRFLVNHYQNRD